MAEERREIWRIVDSRTDVPVSIAAFGTERQALQQIEGWRERDRRGKRQDVHDVMPHLKARRLKDGDW
jgi:hypothetical protein